MTEVTTCWCILTHEGHTTKEGPDLSGPSCAGKNLLLFLRSPRHEVDCGYSDQSDMDVFKHLRLDFVAVSGAQFCCGIVRDKFDGAKQGSRVSERTVTRLEDYQPKQVVMWCPPATSISRTL